MDYLVECFLAFMGLLFVVNILSGVYITINKPKGLPIPTAKFKIGDRVAGYRGRTGRHKGTVKKIEHTLYGFEYTFDEDSAIFNEKQLRKLVKKAK